MRSDNASFNARYSPAGLTAGLAYSTSAGATPVYEADAAAIGGNRFNLGTTSALVRALTYPGRGIFNTKTISVLIRARVLASALIGMYDICSGSPLQCNRFALYQNSSAWKSYITNVNGTILANSLTLSTTAPTTTVYQDWLVTWDGSSTASKIIWYIDAVSTGTATAGGAWSNPQDTTLTDSITIGSVAGGVNNVQMYVNEMVIWNYVIDPTAVALTTGTGSLNGTSRTAFVDVASYDGTAQTGGSGFMTTGIFEGRIV